MLLGSDLIALVDRCVSRAFASDKSDPPHNQCHSWNWLPTLFSIFAAGRFRLRVLCSGLDRVRVQREATTRLWFRLHRYYAMTPILRTLCFSARFFPTDFSQFFVHFSCKIPTFVTSRRSQVLQKGEKKSVTLLDMVDYGLSSFGGIWSLERKGDRRWEVFFWGECDWDGKGKGKGNAIENILVICHFVAHVQSSWTIG